MSDSERGYPQVVLFDLDGTLVDSVPDLSFSLDVTLAELGMPVRGVEAARHWVGNGIERLVKRGLTNDLYAEPDPELLERAMAIFRSVYAENTSRHSRVYPGVFDGLNWLRSQNVNCACVTNKAEQFTIPLLEKLDLAGYFATVVCGDTLPKCKPDPMPLLHVAGFFDASPQNCVMVGDSMHDMAAARAAGFAAVAVPYGYNHGVDIAESGPDKILTTIAEISTLF